ncbi:hypothetical protein N7541_008828 [Penicillium brevicompactum]|uniref:Uncharacterized protein n=1 Tax=Penicillium brevicompactum TaxID=5074 RepID=A0A9W9UL07_PENBR|nr:uncharacterized protein N7506_003980 [Penicillium brevicompactum]KAJ5335958.1 hypothetical protein N7506_003980 [Penicillium brevicompactum]KAJ5346346.1 hypothetical protein N7541_008828 [Penicillium brevicompactum]
MASKGPQAAFVEEFDEDSNATLPGTRLSANIAPNSAVKLSRLDPRNPEPLIDGASDSGYSSRTAATVNSTQSGPSGGKSPPAPLKLDNPKRADLSRKSSTRERRDKERSRPSHDEKMVGAYAGTAHHAHVHRSASKSQRRDPGHARQYHHDNYYDYHGYQPSAPVDTRPGEYPFYQQRPPVPDFSSSPHAPRYGAVESIHVSNPGRSNRSHSYHTYHNSRPMSFHGMPPGMGSGMNSGVASPMYSQSSMHGYDYGPPPSNSAYMQNQYSSSPYGQSTYYAPSEYGAPSEYPRERSLSREPGRHRSNSVYGPPPPPPMDSGAYSPWYEEDQPLERYPSREVRGRPSISQQDPDEDYYRGSMAPPPPPMPKPKLRSTPQVHQVKRVLERPEPRKVHTSTAAVPSQRRASRNLDRDRGADREYDRMDLAELKDSLPVVSDRDRGNRRISRDAPPERTQSMRAPHRSTSYAAERGSAQVAVASSRRRKPTEYYYEPSSVADDLEDRELAAENYQAARSGRASTAALPLSQEVLPPSKPSNRNGSDSGSQKSRSNSSRGSGTGSRTEEDKNMTLTMNGLKIGFTQEAVAGKSINIRTGETGGVRLNIGGGPRQPRQYVHGSGSDYTGGASRHREIEDVRRTREDRRLERGSRRDSQSAYAGGGRYHH